MNGNMITLIFLPFVLNFHGIFSIDFIPQIIEKIETAVILDKGIAYLNCTMFINEESKSRATWISMLDGKQIAFGESLEEPVRKDTDGNNKYIVRFINKRSSYIPDVPGLSSGFVLNYQLVVRQVLESDSMRYQCKIDLASFPDHMRPTAIGLIILQKAPFISPIKSQIVEEGTPLELKCLAKGSPEPRVSWVKANGQPFTLPGSPQRVQNSTLYIPKVSKYDRGVFRCHAVNNVGFSDQLDVMVEVTYKPTVRVARRLGSYGQMANQNYEMMIECIVNGYPDPDLFWYLGNYDPQKNFKQLYDDVRHESQKIVSYGAVGTNVTDVFFVLKILNIQESDLGNYTCRAENRIGSDQATVHIFKQQICQGALCTYFTSYGNTQTISGILLISMGLIAFSNFRLI